MKSRSFFFILSAIVVGSFLLQLHHLGHAAVKPLDEVFHATVARNLLKHPLTPTLIDHPYLDYNIDNWQLNHIWLHKPPMALWQIALSFAVLGVKTFALRLPSAILAALSVGITALLGKSLFDSATGLLAALLQACNPVILMLVHGYVFSDHVDISLLFYTELSLLFLVRAIKSQRRMDFVLCGVAQGLAFLSKTWPALIVTGVAGVIWIVTAGRIVSDQRRLNLKSLIILVLGTVLMVLPWTIYTAIRFPAEFASENLQILHHVDQNIEGWAGPWDRLLFDYWIAIFHVFYPLVLASVIIAIFVAARTRNLSLLILLAWGLGVLFPNLLVKSKTMSSTLIGWPALWLMLAWLVRRALSRDALASGCWIGCAGAAFVFLGRKSIPPGGWGYGPPGFASIMREHLWVVWQLLIGLSVGAAFLTLIRKECWARLHQVCITVAVVLSAVLIVRWWPGDHPKGYAVVAGEVTAIDRERPAFSALGAFADQLPSNAVILVEEQSKLENRVVAFAVDRTCYPVEKVRWEKMALAIAQNGGAPFLLTSAGRSLPVVFDDVIENRTLYACTAEAANAIHRPAK